jgi:hypothetical protein
VRRFILALACAGWMAAVPAADRAQADVLIAINKATQRMTVAVNGREHHRWPVSTGLAVGPRTAACGCILPTPPRCSRWCAVTA